MRTIVLYVFHELNENVHFFLKNGIHDNFKLFLICNNEIDLKLDGYDILYRPNIGFDFQAWSEALKLISFNDYDYFIFLNSSVIGPFVKDGENWTHKLINLLNDNVKLAGCTINNCNNYGELNPNLYSHVQSFCFCVDRIGLDIIYEEIFNSNFITDKNDIIHEKEIKMSRLIINSGYNISSLMKRYSSIDFRLSVGITNQLKMIYKGDIFYDNYFGIYPNEDKYEVMFVKTKRGISKWKINNS